MHRMLKNTKIHLSLVGVFVQSDMIYTFLHSKCSVRNFKSVAFKLMAKWWSILMFGGGEFPFSCRELAIFPTAKVRLNLKFLVYQNTETCIIHHPAKFE